MLEFLTTITTAIAAFIATNIDDILILTLLFASVNVGLSRRQIVIGQYLGFIVLLLVSLPGFFGSFLLPPSWIRGMGMIPLILGIAYLLKGEDEEMPFELPSITNSTYYFLSPQTAAVAAITIANGSDNIGIYIPLFASSNWQSLLAILATFLLLVGVWCYLAYQLTRFQAIASLVSNYGTIFVPSILIGLGVFIVKRNVVLALLTVAASYLWVTSLDNNRVSPEE